MFNEINSRMARISHSIQVVAFVLMLQQASAMQCYAALLPEAGMLIPELAAFDDAMQSVMDANGISAGAAAIMKDGKLIYRRSFGWDDAAHTVPVQENVIMRLASVTKPLTAATIRELISDGQVGLHQRVFSLDEPGTGILDHSPFNNSNYDPRLKNITVNHLLQHRAGWDRGEVGDWTYDEREIAFDMGISSPPGRDATLRWILGHNEGLQFTPGDETAYSNIGYMVLGMIAEEVTGQPHIEAMRDLVFTPLDVTDSMVIHGRTFEVDHDPREPHYDSSTTSLNVFWNIGNGQQFSVNRPYGGWDHEARIGQGALVADPIALLEYMQKYQIAGDNIGGPRPTPGGWSYAHTGGFEGASTIASQHGDGIDYVILFNKKSTVDDASNMFSDIINSGQIDWPAADIRELPPGGPGDINGDGFLNSQDTQELISHWLDDTSHLNRQDKYLVGDINLDGIVDLSDCVLLRDAFFKAEISFTQLEAVPEPSSIAILCQCGLIFVFSPIHRANKARKNESKVF